MAAGFSQREIQEKSKVEVAMPFLLLVRACIMLPGEDVEKQESHSSMVVRGVLAAN